MAKKIESYRVLIAYDGSKSAQTAINDLKNAGLPPKAEVLVFSAAETGFPVAQAWVCARRCAVKIRTKHPSWQVRAEASVGSAASCILAKARKWKPDLIVLGSHGRSTVGRLFWGSVSQTVAAYARCSVRIGRHGGKFRLKPLVIVGMDGSVQAKRAVNKVAARAWPPVMRIHVLAVFDPALSTGVAIDVEGERQYQWLAKNVKTAAHALGKAGLRAQGMVRGGDPKKVIVRKAGKWGALCIFIGARGLSRIQRMMFGSVSTAVAMRAPCSVEIVR